jgi:hypothetical protein
MPQQRCDMLLEKVSATDDGTHVLVGLLAEVDARLYPLAELATPRMA